MTRVSVRATAADSLLAGHSLPVGRSSTGGGWPGGDDGLQMRLVSCNDAKLYSRLPARQPDSGAAALVFQSGREPEPTWASAAVALLGWAYIGSGLVAWRHRPEHRLGPVMVFIGFAWFATFLADAESPFVFTLGTALEDIYLLGFVYLMLSFPSGRLRGRLDRVLITAAIVLTTVVEVAWLLFADSPTVICADCPENVLQVVRSDSVAEGILQAQRVLGLALSLFTAALLVDRWRKATAPERRAVAPVLDRRCDVRRACS